MSAAEIRGTAPTDLSGWLDCAAGLRRKQSENAEALARLAAKRQALALAAATGETRAQRRVEQLAAQEQALGLNALSLTEGLALADAEIAAAQALARSSTWEESICSTPLSIA